MTWVGWVRFICVGTLCLRIHLHLRLHPHSHLHHHHHHPHPPGVTRYEKEGKEKEKVVETMESTLSSTTALSTTAGPLAMMATASVFLFLATVAVVLRVWVRAKVLGSWGWDDWGIVVCWVRVSSHLSLFSCFLMRAGISQLEDH